MESIISRCAIAILCLVMAELGLGSHCLAEEVAPAAGYGAMPMQASHDAPSVKHQNGKDFDDKLALKTSQAAIGRSVEDFTLLDRQGQEVRLADYRGKPLLISFIYTACFHTCPIITQNLARVTDIARDTFGDDSFQMLTVGFDTSRDSPDKMRIFARQQGVANEPNWAFLSGDEDTIKRLADTLGFIFFPSPKGFDHLAQTTVIDARGVVYRQLYGQKFDPPMLVEPLKELIFGASPDGSILSGLIGKARLWCTTYDPLTDSYRFQYSMVAGFVISILFLIGSGILLARMWMKVLRHLKS